MSTTLWTILAVAVAVAVFYVLAMRVLSRQSKEAVKKIDYSKVKEWKDEDD